MGHGGIEVRYDATKEDYGFINKNRSKYAREAGALAGVARLFVLTGVMGALVDVPFLIQHMRDGTLNWIDGCAGATLIIVFMYMIFHGLLDAHAHERDEEYNQRDRNRR